MSRAHRLGGAAAVLLWVFCGQGCRRKAELAERAPAPPRGAGPKAAVEELDSATRTRRAAGGRTPVIWLGLDGLDWELLDRLAAAGRMPNWKRLTAQGYTARLESFSPLLSPIVWTTVATGVGPDVHRVLDFQEVDPATGQKVPISGRSRAVPAIWNVASAAGVSVGVVGWWATHPAEEVSGFLVSDHASPILFEGLPRTGATFPANLSGGLEQIVARDADVSTDDLARLVDVPRSEIERLRPAAAGLENPLVALSRILGATRVQHRIGRDLYDRTLPDLLMLYFEGTDAIGHVFASFMPPKLACVSEEEFRRYSRAVDAYYEIVDRLIGQWMRRADEDGATLIVNSDHGFRWGEDRPCETSSLRAAGAAYWHRRDGVLAAYGAGVRRSAERGAASVFDLAPTVSALTGVPVDSRMSGRVLRQAFPAAQASVRKGVFDTVPVRRVAAEAPPEKESTEYAARLRALGYLSGGEPTKLSPTGGDRPGPTEKSWHNLGLYLRDSRRDFRGAEAAFQKALELQPNSVVTQSSLAALYRDEGDDRKAIDWLFRALAAGRADPEEMILRWYVDYDERGKPARAREVLERGGRAYPDSEAIAREIGLVRYRRRDCRSAWDSVARFESVSRTPETLNVLALFQGCLGRKDDAIALFQRSLAINPDQPAVTRSIAGLQSR